MDSSEYDHLQPSDWAQPPYSTGDAIGLPTDAPGFTDASPFVAQNNVQAAGGPNQYGASGQFMMSSSFAQPAFPTSAPQMAYQSYGQQDPFHFHTYPPNASQAPIQAFYPPMNTSGQQIQQFPPLQVPTESGGYYSLEHTPTSAGDSVSPQNYMSQAQSRHESPSQSLKRKTQMDTPPHSEPSIKRVRYDTIGHGGEAGDLTLARKAVPRIKPLQPQCEAVLDKIADFLRPQISLISTTEGRSPHEIMSRIIAKTARKSSLPNPVDRTKMLQAPYSSDQERASQDHLRVSRARQEDIKYFQGQVLARRHVVCHARSIRGALPCLRQGCPGRWEDKGAWVRHLAQLIPDRLWICCFCREVLDRKERLEGHLSSKHKGELPDAIQQCVAQEPYKVPFHGQCGFCPFQSTNWTFFWLTHVHEHLIGKNGPRREKEEWDQPYPPPVTTHPSHRPRIPRDSLDSLRGSGGDDDDMDDDDNDDGFSPSGSGGSNTFNASRARSDSQRSAGKGKGTQAYYSASNTGNTYTCHTQQTILINELSTTSSRRKSLSKVQKLPKRRSSELYLQVSDQMTESSSQSQWSCHSPVSTLSNIRYGVDDGYPPYSHVRTLFQGPTTVVDQVRHRPSGSLVVRKRVRALDDRTSLQSAFAREVGTMKQISHPHMTNLIEAVLTPTSYSLFLDPVGDYTLKQYLECPPEGNLAALQKWHHCLSSAVSYLHGDSVAVCHLDIKPSNIMITGTSIFLGDFGIARKCDFTPGMIGSSASETHPKSMPMTPMYAAPELIEKGLWSRKADVFALGCVFLEMATVMCHLSIQKFYGFLLLVRQQTRELARHDSWDVGRTLWTWVLKYRSSSSSKAQRKLSRVQQPSDDFLQQSTEACLSMLRHDSKRRPSMRTLSKTFAALMCCKSATKEQELTLSSSSDGLSEAQLVRLSFESSKYLFSFQAVGIRHGFNMERASSAVTKQHFKSQTWEPSQALSNMGIWTARDEQMQPQLSSSHQSFDTALEAGMVPHSQRRPRKSGSWPTSKAERKALATTGSSFYAISGEFYVKRKAEDLKSNEVKWHGWSRLCHNLPFPPSLGDVTFLQSVMEDQQRRKAALCADGLDELSDKAV